MRNISSTAIKSVPTRLILKQGDDLRQDMITLKMFSLFQKVSPIISFVTCLLSYTSSLQLWEKDGLPNMCLIPYGCMATSPKTGFIEVVKSARTIAEVVDSVFGYNVYSYWYTKQYHCISAWAVLVKTNTCVWLLYLRFWLNLFCCMQVSAINNKTNLFEWIKSHQKKYVHDHNSEYCFMTVDFCHTVSLGRMILRSWLRLYEGSLCPVLAIL